MQCIHNKVAQYIIYANENASTINLSASRATVYSFFRYIASSNILFDNVTSGSDTITVE